MTAACRIESRLVPGGEGGNFLEPPLGARRCQHLDDSRRVGTRVPHGVDHVRRFQRPASGASDIDLIANEDSNFPEQHVDPDVILVRRIRVDRTVTEGDMARHTAT